MRNRKSRDVISRIHAWALAQRVLPESSLGKAIAYVDGRWKGLVRFLEDARIPLDKNATERALRGPLLGRKNHYGSKSRRGNEVAALFYTFCETSKLVDIEPRRYLRAAVGAALDGIRIPLPHDQRRARVISPAAASSDQRIRRWSRRGSARTYRSAA